MFLKFCVGRYSTKRTWRHFNSKASKKQNQNENKLFKWFSSRSPCFHLRIKCFFNFAGKQLEWVKLITLTSFIGSLFLVYSFFRNNKVAELHIQCVIIYSFCWLSCFIFTRLQHNFATGEFVFRWNLYWSYYINWYMPGDRMKLFYVNLNSQEYLYMLDCEYLHSNWYAFSTVHMHRTCNYIILCRVSALYIALFKKKSTLFHVHHGKPHYYF